jgi:diketogulonate reductase-like aldo/keto reductase
MNFDKALIEQILQVAQIKPVTNQIEYHYLLKQNELRKYLM